MTTPNIFGPAIGTIYVLGGLAVLGGIVQGRFETAVWVILGSFVYFLPALIAENRRHRERVPIYLVNLLLGWTFIGWVVALVWSCTSHLEAQP